MIGPDQLAAARARYAEFAEAIRPADDTLAAGAEQVMRILTGLGVDEAAAGAAASDLLRDHVENGELGGDWRDLNAYAAGWVDGFFLGVVAARTEMADNAPGGLAAPPDAPTT